MCSFGTETDLTAFGNFLTTLISKVLKMKPCLLFTQYQIWKAWRWAGMCFFLEPSFSIENVHGHRRLLGGLTSLDSIKQSFLQGKKTELKLEKSQTRSKGASRNHQTWFQVQSLAQSGPSFLIKSAYFGCLKQ